MPKKTVPLQAETIKQLVDREHSVDVDGVSIVLRAPSPADAGKVRVTAFELGEDQEGMNDSKAIRGALIVTGMAVQACTGGISLEYAQKLVLLAGGERGVLARTALKLVGMGEKFFKALDEGEADPTS